AQTLAAGRSLLLEPPDVDVARERLRPQIPPDCIVLVLAELDRAERRKVLSVVRRLDARLGRLTFRNLNAALRPHLRDVVLPSLTHALDEAVRASEQKDVRLERVSPGQNRQVLEDDRVEERRHQLVGWRAFLLQTVDIR